jgi:hypothetical protein
VGWAAAVTALALAAPAAAQRAPFHYAARAGVTPVRVRLAEPVSYRGQVVVPHALRVQWLPPDSGGALTWGPLEATRSAGAGRAAAAWDTLRVRTTVQAFATGKVTIPGLAFRSASGGGTVHRLPGVALTIVPTVPASDTAADLRAVRGPLAAPWWERVPWMPVGLALAVLAALVWLVVWLRRRRRRAVPAAAPVVRPPGEEALAALAALRGLHLPEHERFGEHAWHLTRIVRRYLEATERTPRPGDTTPELVHRLDPARLGPDDVARLAALLATWDRLKFARAASSVEEARGAEDTLEAFIRRRMAADAATKVAA